MNEEKTNYTAFMYGMVKMAGNSLKIAEKDIGCCDYTDLMTRLVEIENYIRYIKDVAVQLNTETQETIF